MSEDKITLELLGARLMALTADVRDLQQRFLGIEARLGGVEGRISGLEARISGLETRFGVQEERMARMLALIVRIAERVGGAAE
jgi:hypothetical protein